MTKNRVVLITGASSGLGRDFAKTLIKEDLIVYAAARRVEKMTELKELGVIPLKMDISQEDDIHHVVETIKANHGGVDIIINNAGFGLYGTVEETTIEEARYQFEVNLFGLARLTQLLLPAMRAKKAGTIINISSMLGKVYSPLGAWYTASKHALEGWSDSLRLELQPFGIHVVIIEPGAMRTEFTEVMRTPMLQRSGNGPYAKFTQKVAKLVDRESKSGGGDSPAVITQLVIKALRANRPKIRYVAGKYAKLSIFARKWFGDRLFDKVLLSVLK